MKKSFLMSLVCVSLLCSAQVVSAEYSDRGFRAPIEDSWIQDATGLDDSDVAWLRDVARAIQLVETGGCKNPAEAVGKAGEVGPLQIRECVLVDVKDRYKKAFILKQAKHLDSAVEIFCLYTARYNKHAVKERNLERVARCWNGGPEGHLKAATLEYASKVKTVFDTISAE